MLFSTLLVFGQILASAGLPVSTPPAPRTSHAVAVTALAGRVLTEYGEPLPGVFVAVPGTSLATSTNAAGNFLLALSEAKSTVTFKCQGYRDQTMAVAGGAPLTVRMSAVTGTVSSREAAASSEASTAAKVLKFAEVMPSYPGGDDAYRAYLRQNARFPEAAMKARASGTVFVSFVVDEQGRIVNAEIVRGAGHGFDEEALRLVRLMPWWNPGTMAGQPVRVSQVLRLPFEIRTQH